jgi:hypothetical protein
MSDQTIFNKDNVPADNQVQQKEGEASNTPNVQSDAPFADMLGSITNERGEPKYKSPEDAFKALQHSQQFIPQLQQENMNLRSEVENLRSTVERLKKVEEVVERLTANQSQGEKTTQPAIDEQTIAALMERTLTKREIEARQKANVSQVAGEMSKKFGADAEKVFYSKAVEMGMDAQTINNLAATSPQAVLHLFGLQSRTDRDVKPTAPAMGGINTAGFQPQKDSFVGRNTQSLSYGATTQDYIQEGARAKQMVEELHEQGLSVSDLSDPKKYFATFK